VADDVPVQSRVGRTVMTAVVLASVPWVATGCARQAIAEDELGSTCASSLGAGWQTVSIRFEGQSYAVDVFSRLRSRTGRTRSCARSRHALMKWGLPAATSLSQECDCLEAERQRLYPLVDSLCADNRTPTNVYGCQLLRIDARPLSSMVGLLGHSNRRCNGSTANAGSPTFGALVRSNDMTAPTKLPTRRHTSVSAGSGGKAHRFEVNRHQPCTGAARYWR
jgi:hypothetical protein